MDVSTTGSPRRDFAVEVVRALRGAGFEALWAGGCVRDELLGRVPKDYDVATGATPEEIRHCLGRRRTLPVGAAFGVVLVVGPRGAGSIDVATFRRDESYEDGRRPTSVTFTTAEEDARRRDFTINGLFYDPLGDRVIDYVGGRDDLAAGLVRTIGRPEDRFGEDKLRLLRAVRFAAAYEFQLEAATRDAIGRMAGEITVVSGERIGQELRWMLAHPTRGESARLLVETGLLAAVLPEIAGGDVHWPPTYAALSALRSESFPVALAELLYGRLAPDQAAAACRRLRMTGKESGRACWLLRHAGLVTQGAAIPWPRLQRVLVQPGGEELVAWEEARVAAGMVDGEGLVYCRGRLAQPREVLNPPPLVTGDDLIRHGVRPGAVFKHLLEQVRDAQLEGQVTDRAEALELVDRLLDNP